MRNDPRANLGSDGEDQFEDVVAAFWAMTDLLPDAQQLIETFQAKVTAEDSIVVIDASSLLLPYETRHSIEPLNKIFTMLAERKRLCVPSHAIREFYLKRSDKLIQIGKKIKSITEPPTRSNFNKVPDFIIRGGEANIQALYDAAYNRFKDDLDGIGNQLQMLAGPYDGRGADVDTLSKMYSARFAQCIYEPAWTPQERKELQKEFTERRSARLPPGFKDGEKNGDFLFWKSVLRIASEKKRDCLLVTQETKSDWFVRNDAAPVQLRPELIAEFSRMSGGKNIQALSLSAFVKQFEGNAEQVLELLLAEFREKMRSVMTFARRSNLMEQIGKVRIRVEQFQGMIRAQAFMIDKRPMPPSGVQRDMRLKEIEDGRLRMAAMRAAYEDELSRAQAEQVVLEEQLNELTIDEGELDEVVRSASYRPAAF